MVKDKELDENSTTENFSVIRQEGNRKVKRNIEKFAENFKLQLTQEKYEILRSQIVTLKKQKNTNKQGVFFDGYIFTKAIV